MIVDDEPFQIKGLENMILAKHPDLRIQTARNGRAALAKINDFHPDLVITDIRMSVMDGLQLAKIIRDGFPKVRVALISAYQEFDYAKQAIRLSVLDYLVKPYQPKDVEALLSRVEKAERVPPDASGNPAARTGEKLVSRLLAGTGEKSADLSAFPELKEPGCVVNCVFCFSDLRKEPPYEIDFGTVASRLEKWLKPRCKSFFVDGSGYRSGDGGVNLVFPHLSDGKAMDLMREMRAFVRSEFGLDLDAGISDTRGNLAQEMHQAAEQAREARSFQFYRPVGSLIPYRSVADSGNVPFPSMCAWEQQCADAVVKGDWGGINRLFDDMAGRLLKEPRCDPEIVKRRVSVLASSILRRYEHLLYAADLNRLQNEIDAKFFGAPSLGLLMDAFRKALHAAASLIGARDEQGHDKIVRQCLDWIEKNIGREISLMEAAEHFHFNSSYFSSLIKQKTGMSYGRFVLSLRMKRAKELLQGSDEKVQDIALKTGYRDPSYFNRVFKRETGVTPDQFRRRTAD